MKRTFTLIIFAITLSISALYAQVERDMVILEIGTGTWCQYCPGAAMGADELIENGKDVAVIEYHSGDDYQYSFCSTRISYYGITGFPTAKFDGTLTKEGGSNTQSMYAQYLPLYNSRKAINSSFTIDIEGELLSITDYTATVTVEKVSTYSGSNLRLYFVLTESHIEESWQGMDELNYVARSMVPSVSGTTLDFSGGNTQTIDLEFSLGDDWNFEEMEVVAFVQNYSTKEILQGTKIDLTEFPAAFDNNASVDVINNVPVENCTETVIPIAKIRNNGSEVLTSLDFEYRVNEEETHTYSWTGSLEFAETELVELDEIPFTLENQNKVEVTASNPNGVPDEYPDNDTQESEIFTGAIAVPMEIKMMLRLDKNPEETSWDIRNSANEIVFEGGDYTTPNQNIIENFEFVEQDCYTFNIYDTGEDGLSTPGFYMLMYGNNEIIIQNTNFGGEESIQFGAGGFVNIDENTLSNSLSLYPNPAKNLTELSFNTNEEALIGVDVFDLTGKKVYSLSKSNFEAGNHIIQIDTKDYQAGIYLIKLNVNGTLVTEKLSINK